MMRQHHDNPTSPTTLALRRLKFGHVFCQNVSDEAQPALVTVESCPQCGYKRERDERTGDFVFERTGACPKCSANMEITAIYAKPDFRARSQLFHLAIALLTISSFLLTLSRLGDVPYPYFDESHYLQAGEALVQFMISRPQFTDPHPPLAKIIIGAGLVFFGQNPIGWRLLDAVFATLTIPLLYIFARKLFGPRPVTILPPILLTFDFMHFVLAKLAILDGIFVFFAVLMQYAFYIYYSDTKEHSYSHSNLRLILAAITAGLAIAAKWPAVFSLLGFGIVFLYLTWQRSRKSYALHIPLRTTLYPILAGILGLITTGAVYLVTWLPYVLGGWSVNQVLYWQRLMYQFQTTVSRGFLFDSRWWSWPLMLTPLTLIFRPGPRVVEILVMGNPAIWWTTYPLLALSVYRVIAKRTEKLTYLVLAFLSSWLPFALLSRFQIIYYFYVSLPMLILILSYWLQLALAQKPGKIIVLSYLTVVIALFALYYPALTAEPISQELAERLRWLPSWGP